jgi:magnesium-transporting ATPase (P-type)
MATRVCKRSHNIMWGRCVNDAVRKFLQFQINRSTPTLRAFAITFVTATSIAAASEEYALSAVKLLWINLVMVPRLRSRRSKPPKPWQCSTASRTSRQIFSSRIIRQSTYLIFRRSLGIINSSCRRPKQQKHQDTAVQTLVFNAFVFTQIWNSFNSRGLVPSSRSPGSIPLLLVSLHSYLAPPDVDSGCASHFFSLSFPLSLSPLTTIIGHVPSRCIVLLEDLDTAFTRSVSRAKKNEKENLSDVNTLTLNRLLNAPDGVAAAKGRILCVCARIGS